AAKKTFFSKCAWEASMTSAAAPQHGSVASLWRYTVKSMLGEELSSAQVTDRGLAGDRAFALVDPESGRVISAKNPRKWGNLFSCRAALVEDCGASATLPAARITFPDGSTSTTAEPGIENRLSDAVGKRVRLAASAPAAAPAPTA